VEFSTSNCEGGLIDVLMEPADNMILDLKLTCHFSAYGNTMVRMNGSIGEILLVFKKWQHLRRLALVGCRPIDLMEEEWIMNPWRMPSAAECPSLNLVCDFILDMKGLTYLSITDDFNDEEMMALKVEVDDWVKLHRPGFIFEMRNSKTLSSDDCWCSF
jgi:hypothetical protein